MENLINKFQQEINYIREIHPQIEDGDLSLALKIDAAIKTIKNYNDEDYDFMEHFSAVMDLVMNQDKRGEDGLTNLARGILHRPKLKCY